MGFWNSLLNQIISLSSGEENKVTVNDLRPATDYHAKWVSLFIKFGGHVLKFLLDLIIFLSLWVTNQRFWLSWPLSPFWKTENCCTVIQHPLDEALCFLCQNCNIFLCFEPGTDAACFFCVPEAAEVGTLYRRVLTAGHLKVRLCCFCFAPANQWIWPVLVNVPLIQCNSTLLAEFAASLCPTEEKHRTGKM